MVVAEYKGMMEKQMRGSRGAKTRLVSPRVAARATDGKLTLKHPMKI